MPLREITKKLFKFLKKQELNNPQILGKDPFLPQISFFNSLFLRFIFISLLSLSSYCVTVPDDEITPEDEELEDDESWINFNQKKNKNKP